MDRTIDGRVVFKNAFFFLDTVGLPLEIIDMKAKTEGFQVSWVHFTIDALHAGWEWNTIIYRIKEVRDSDIIISRLHDMRNIVLVK